MSKRDILVVFDIDETLIQFVNRNAYHYWKEVTPQQKQIIDENLQYLDKGEEKKQVIFFRPGLKEFLEMALNSGRIKVAIWTYSERRYANQIAKDICDTFELPKDLFVFKYGSEDIDDDIPKSLDKIWTNPKFSRKFNKFNTFLVDDRFENLCHEINEYNSILVQAFAPFGETKAREPLTSKSLTRAINDDIFNELTHITNNLLTDIDGCEDEEIEEAFTEEAVFAPKCMQRKGLTSYVKKYKNKRNKDVKLCTIGHVENAASSIKGGKNKSYRINKNIKTYKYNNKYRKVSRKYKNKRTTKKRRM
jgi:hypothetical protein